MMLSTARWVAFLATLGAAARPEVTLLEVLGQPFTPTEGASEDCLEHGALYLTALGNYTPWALRMYDASSKMPSGVITGNYKQLGNYDECLRVESGHGFVGQACSATVQFVLPELSEVDSIEDPDMRDLLLNVAVASGLTNWTSGSSVLYEWMWCVPSTCTHSEIMEALEIVLDPLKVEGRLELLVNVNEDSCHTAKTDARVLDTADWIYIALLLSFSTIVLVSTAYDMVKLKSVGDVRKDAKHTILTAFSLYTNGKSLLSTKRRGDCIGCLDGLRYLSICWIIYGHTHYLQVVGVQLDLTGISKMHENWSTLMVLNGNIVTDTFFLLSGLLLAYTELSKKQRNPDRGLNIFTLYAHRYFRLTPSYAIVIGLYSTIFYKMGTGPHWDTWVGANRNFCRENWWTNLLYVNNYVNVASMCMSQTWYLAVDMQLLWLSPLFLYPMLKFTRSLIFWLVLGIGLAVSIVTPFAVTYILELTGTMLYYKEQAAVADVFLQIYTRMYARAGPYIIGLGMGYLLCRTRSQSLKIPKTYAACGWSATIVCGLAVIFGPRGMYFEDHVYSRIEASFYAGLHRPVFALAVAWIIFACVHGCGGPIDGLLSWSGWMPLSKLTYSAYLSHYLILLYNSGTVRTPGYLTTYNVVHEFFGNLVLSMSISLVITLCLEMPFMVLGRVFLGNRSLQPEQKSNGMKFRTPGNEIYRSLEDTISTISQMYTDIVDVSKHDVETHGATYGPASNISSGYYIDQVEKSKRCEHVYTDIIETISSEDESARTGCEAERKLHTVCRPGTNCKLKSFGSGNCSGDVDGLRKKQKEYTGSIRRERDNDRRDDYGGNNYEVNKIVETGCENKGYQSISH